LVARRLEVAATKTAKSTYVDFMKSFIFVSFVLIMIEI
jgi:hypothetical protein